MASLSPRKPGYLLVELPGYNLELVSDKFLWLVPSSHSMAACADKDTINKF